MYAHMLSESSIAFLKRLLDTPGPSGFESAPAKLWRDEARPFAEVTNDVAGNSLAVVNAEGSPTIMLAGHIDEIGVIITYIDDEGYLYISGIGGWDTQVLVGQRIRIMARDGHVFGVIGKKPIHVIKPDDRKKASEMTDLWIDIGAASREDAERIVSVGDPGVIDSRTIDFPNSCIVSRSIDDRIGAFIVLEALRRYADKPGAARVVAVATTQEEIAFQGGGARVSATRVGPANGDRGRRDACDGLPGRREEGARPPQDRRGARAHAWVDHLAGRVLAAARHGNASLDSLHGTRGGARVVDRRRRHPRGARRCGDGAAVDPEPLHALT